MINGFKLTLGKDNLTLLPLKFETTQCILSNNNSLYSIYNEQTIQTNEDDCNVSGYLELACKLAINFSRTGLWCVWQSSHWLCSIIQS